MPTNINVSKKIAFLGLMLAMIIILSTLENLLPPNPFLPPNFKLGLSNIVTMYCVFFISKQGAFFIIILKSFFVFLTRGAMAGSLSLCGGLLSISVIIILVLIFKNRISYVLTSVFGALFHNIGQFLAIFLILGSVYSLYYLPFVLISGVIMGVITGILLKVVLPIFAKTMQKITFK